MNLNLAPLSKKRGKIRQKCQDSIVRKAPHSPSHRSDMILFVILGLLCVSGAEEQLEEQQQECNCTRVLHAEEATTEVAPTFPTTSFTCWGRYDGYYADIEVDCTIFHYCQTWQFPSGLNETVKWDFACPQSTIFNQKILSCTPPSISFDCQESPNYYWVNYNFTLSSTPTPPVDVTAPTSNIGQQLIVGGLEPHSQHSVVSSEPTPVSVSLNPAAQNASEEFQTPIDNSTPAVEMPPSPNLGEQNIENQQANPIDSSEPTSNYESGSGDSPTKEFDGDAITFPS